MTYNPCDKTRITYSGNGSQTDFTFQFTYTDETDVIVWLYNDNKTEWIEQQNTYVFAGPTIIRFITAPPRATNPEGFNIVIGRRTNVSIIDSTFYPGSSIRAQDLNDNFEQLRAGIEDGRCELSSSLEELKYDYWGKKSVSKRDALLTDDPPNDTTYREDQEEGYWPTDGDTKSVPTTGAVSARLDPYVQGSLPANLPNDGEQPVGKTWINTDQYWDSYWEPAANAWVAYINTGPRGQDGSPGETGDKGDTGFAAVIGKIGPGAWDDIAPQEPVVGALYIAVTPITGFPGGGVPESGDALGFNGEQWIDYGKLGTAGPIGPEGPEGPEGPQGPEGNIVGGYWQQSGSTLSPVDGADNLAVDGSATFVSGDVVITDTGIIRTWSSGAVNPRIEFNGGGLGAFDGSDGNTIQLSSSDGSATFASSITANGYALAQLPSLPE